LFYSMAARQRGTPEVQNFSLRTKYKVPLFGLLALTLPFMIFIIYRQLSGVTTDFA